MNWLTFAITAYLGYALQQALAPVWAINGREPLLLLVVLVFIGLQAPAGAVAWAAIVLGVLADIEMQQNRTGLIGPWALGFLTAGYALVQLRNLLFRDSVLTISIMTLAAGVFTLLVSTALYAMRGVSFLAGDKVPGFSAADELFGGFLMLLYTAVAALPAGYLLIKSKEYWGFSSRGLR